MKAIIIAGGSGTRLRPLTYQTPKPMMPIFDKPLLHHQLDMLKRHGIREVVINVHYLAASIVDYFGDGSAFGMAIAYSSESRPMGTAGAVKLAEPYFDGEPLLVLNGDILTSLDLQALLAFHEAKAAKATLAMIRVPDPTAFGLIFTDEAQRVTRFLEKPSWDEATTDTVNAGAYVLDTSVFQLVPQGEAYSFERGLFPLLLQLGEPVYGWATDAYWLDIGSPHKYHQAHADVLRGRIALDLEAEQRAPGLWVGADVDLAPGVQVDGPAYLGRGVRIGRGARLGANAVLARGVRVEDRADLEDVLVGAGTVIEEAAQVRHCMVGPDCRIGAAACVGRHVVLGDGSQIARGSLLGL